MPPDPSGHYAVADINGAVLPLAEAAKLPAPAPVLPPAAPVLAPAAPAVVTPAAGPAPASKAPLSAAPLQNFANKGLNSLFAAPAAAAPGTSGPIGLGVLCTTMIVDGVCSSVLLPGAGTSPQAGTVIPQITVTPQTSPAPGAPASAATRQAGPSLFLTPQAEAQEKQSQALLTPPAVVLVPPLVPPSPPGGNGPGHDNPVQNIIQKAAQAAAPVVKAVIKARSSRPSTPRRSPAPTNTMSPRACWLASA
jgi:hypothetical protein